MPKQSPAADEFSAIHADLFAAPKDHGNFSASSEFKKRLSQSSDPHSPIKGGEHYKMAGRAVNDLLKKHGIASKGNEARLHAVRAGLKSPTVEGAYHEAQKAYREFSAQPISGVGIGRKWSKEDISFVKTAAHDPKHPAHENAKAALRHVLIADEQRKAGKMGEAKMYARRGLAHVIVGKKKAGVGNFAANEPLHDKEPALRPPFYAKGVTRDMVKEGGVHYHRQNAFRLRNAASAMRAKRDTSGNASTLEADAQHHENMAKKLEKAKGGNFAAEPAAAGQKAQVLGMGMDKNGNHVVKVGHSGGSFTIQTNGNVPSAHRAAGTKVKDLNPDIHGKIMKEAHDYVSKHGTARAKGIMGISGKTSTK